MSKAQRPNGIEGRRRIICLPRTPLLRMHFNQNGEPKVRWPNRASAEYVADLAALRRRRRGQEPKPTEVYFCSVCDGWHLGAPMKPQRHHTMPERHPELLVELGVRVVSCMWGQNRRTIMRDAWVASNRRKAAAIR